MLNKVLFKIEEILFKQKLRHLDKNLNYPHQINELIKHNRKILFYLININNISKKEIINEINLYFLREKCLMLNYNFPNFSYENIDKYQKFLIEFVEKQDSDINKIIKDFKIRTKLLEYYLNRFTRSNNESENKSDTTKKTA